MELTFNKEGNRYVAEFQTSSDFALHIEKTDGSIGIFSKSVEGGKYDYVRSLNVSQYDKVIDVDVVGVVYPKWIKVESSVMPTMAVVTFAE